MSTVCTRILLVLLSCSPLAAVADDAPIEGGDLEVMQTQAFLNAHPDMKYRTEGWQAYAEGDFAQARTLLEKAASYGDKPAQALLAEMAWKGQGQPVDRALAYAWADLAAERGYRLFVAQRENYWRQLDAGERERAVEIGQPMLATYADEVATRKLDSHLLRERFSSANWRRRKALDLVVPGPDGLRMVIRGHAFYQDKFWEPTKYREWIDAVWTDPPKTNVEVGDPTPAGGR